MKASVSSSAKFLFVSSSSMASLTTSGLFKTPLDYPRTPANYRQYPTSAYRQRQGSNSLKSAFPRRAIRASASNSGPSTSSSPGLYSAQQFELTIGNVDLVLEDVRPYLIADGGDVDVVSVEDGVVSLKLIGACGSCPSSTTTMKMGIERVLKEKFGDSVKEICQVYDEVSKETTPEAVNSHLDILRPAIRNYSGSVEVISINGGDCLVKYEGPESIGTGIKAAIKERFPDITNVVFSS